MHRTLIQAVAALVLAASLSIPAAAGKTNRKPLAAGSSNVAARGTAYATGYGAIGNEEQNDAAAYLKARNDAKLDALRNLVMRINHVRIDSSATNSGLDAKDRIKAEVHGFVDGAQIISERQIPCGRNTILEVTVAVPLGPNHVPNVDVAHLRGLKAIAMKPRVVIRVAAAPVAPPAPCAPRQAAVSVYASASLSVRCPQRRAPAASAPVAAAPAPCPPRSASVRPSVTGLIVDARGLGVDRDMAPKIRGEDGSVLWGNDEVDIESLIEKGLVTYAHSLREAHNNCRAGENPMVVRAIRRSGGPFNCDVVLNEEDADRVMRSNRRNEFLENWSVVFVVDRDR